MKVLGLERDYEWKNRAKDMFLKIDANYNDQINYP